MSYLFELYGSNSTVLVDCGPLVFDRLYNLNPWKRISAIILTSCEESSIGSLSTIVKMMRSSKDAPVNIICMPHVEEFVRQYLFDANGIGEEGVLFHAVGSSDVSIAFGFTPSIRYTLRRTNPNFSMLVMEISVNNEKVFLVHSGFIDRPALDALSGHDSKALLALMKKHPENTIIFHDAVFQKKEGHCQFDELLKWSDIHRNIFLFGHPFDEGNNINFSQRYMSSLSTKADNVLLLEKQ